MNGGASEAKLISGPQFITEEGGSVNDGISGLNSSLGGVSRGGFHTEAILSLFKLKAERLVNVNLRGAGNAREKM